MILMPNGMEKDESVSKFKDWYLKPRALGTIRILSGFRSAGKTELFRAALPAVEAAAPSVKTVYIDLEGAEYQAMRTADLMWGLVAGRCPKGRFRLVLDESLLGPGPAACACPGVRPMRVRVAHLLQQLVFHGDRGGVLRRALPLA